MPKKKYNLEKILTLAEGEQVPGPSQLEVTPEGLVKTPNQTRVENMMAQALSPVTTPEATSVPKLIVNTTLDDLGITPKEERPHARELKNINDMYGLDKEHVKKLILEQEQEQNLLQQIQDQIRTTPLTPDMKPLAALLDAQTGGKLAASMPEGVTREDRAKQLADIEKLVIGAKQGATDDALKILANDQAQKQLALMSGRQNRFERSFDLKTYDAASKEADKLAKEAYDYTQNVSAVKDAITPDADGTVSVGRVQQALSRFARLMGESGALAEGDIGRQLQNNLQLTYAKYASLLTSDPNVKIPVSAVQSMVDSLAAAEKVFQENYGKKTASFENKFRIPGSPYEGVEWAPGLIENVKRPLSVRPSTIGSAPAGAMGFDEWKKSTAGAK